MFTVSEAEAAAIWTAFDEGGELSTALELRRLFPGVSDKVKAGVRSDDRWMVVATGAGVYRDAVSIAATIVIAGNFDRRNAKWLTPMRRAGGHEGHATAC